ncbi:MAG TPA: MGMT family protein [Gammaproteobacteria bacterium]|nr:MGMT family protein [Gammaproteobacteria bacterium]
MEDPWNSSSGDPLYARIYASVLRIPRGRVSTYGYIARVVGECSARQVGYALAALPEGSRVPWHRVINYKGEISGRKHGSGSNDQRQRLRAEGIAFDFKGRINLQRYGWHRH